MEDECEGGWLRLKGGGERKKERLLQTERAQKTSGKRKDRRRGGKTGED